MLSLLRASHFGPTFAVTLVSFLLAVSLWWEGPAFIIAFGVFLGQLLVGWSNDLNDYQDDILMLYLFSRDTIEQVSWDRIVDEYLILRRYDLTLEDLEDINWTITYP